MMRRLHRRLTTARHPEPALSVTLNVVRTVVLALGVRPKELAARAVHGLSQPRLKRPDRRGRSNLLATELHHLGDPFGHFGRRPKRSTDKGVRDHDTGMGTLLLSAVYGQFGLHFQHVIALV